MSEPRHDGSGSDPSPPTEHRDVPVLILCGGQGTRIREASEQLPKPMIDIGGRPILWHIMKLYADQGFRRFVLCLGYKGWEIKRFFLEYRELVSDFSMRLHGQSPTFHTEHATTDWEITFAETGLQSGTGSRIARAKQYLEGDRFLMTYGDGLADVDIGALLDFHLASGAVGTVTGVHPTSRFGEMRVDGSHVVEFNEKPTQVTGWVSGGFFAFERSFIDDYLDERADLFLEAEPLQRLARDGRLAMRPHEGFWASMDTYRDYLHLNEMWDRGEAPWLKDGVAER